MQYKRVTLRRKGANWMLPKQHGCMRGLIRITQQRLQLFFAQLLYESTAQSPDAVGLGAGMDHLGKNRGGDYLIAVREIDFQDRVGVERVIAQQVDAATGNVLNLREPSQLLAAGLSLNDARHV